MRKLAVFSFSCSAAVFLCNYLLPQDLWLLSGLGCLSAGGAAWPLLRGKRRLLAALVCVGGALGFLWTAAFDAVFFQPARELDDTTIRLTATVLDYPVQRDYGWQVSARMETEGGTPLKLVLYTDDQGADLRPGDQIATVAHMTLGSYSAGGEDITYYTAKGIFLWGQCYGLLTVERPERLPIRHWPAQMAHDLKRGIDLAFSGGIAPLVRAVVTGSRDKLTDSFTSSLERTGLSHAVAVSGMHLSCFAGILSMLLGRGRRSVAVLVMGWSLLFCAVAGSTPSVSRAAVMILLLEAAPLVRRQRDSATSLGFALMLLLLWNPYSAAHIGRSYPSPRWRVSC